VSAYDIKKNIAMGIAAFGAAFLTVGIFLDDAAWVVVGLMHLISAAMWAYGQTLHKP
jgi:hypothetical protein